MHKTARIVPHILALAACCVHADRGSIPFDPGVRIFEPNQRAMIAWNGQEEILLLSTDLRASQPTKVLEVIPLPAEPEVKKGDRVLFSKYSGTEVKIDGEDHLIVREDDILGVIEK